MRASVLAVLLLLLTGCSASKQPTSTGPNSTSMLAGNWVIEISGTNSSTVTAELVASGTPVYDASAQVGLTSCNLSWEGAGWAGSVTGPACFTAGSPVAQLTSSDVNGSPVSTVALLVGVPNNPTPNGAAFQFYYEEVFNGASNGWSIIGNGTITNGVASGTWECDTAVTSACTGVSGTFSATQQ